MPGLIYKLIHSFCFKLYKKFCFKSDNTIASFFLLALEQNISHASYKILLMFSSITALVETADGRVGTDLEGKRSQQ